MNSNTESDYYILTPCFSIRFTFDAYEEIATVIEGLKHHPVPYDDMIVRQLIYYIKVVSKNMIQIYFKDGTTLDAEI